MGHSRTDPRQPRWRYFHPRFKATAVELLPGEHYVTDDPEEMLMTTLGSCVAACVRHPERAVGGMNHFMLPDSRDGLWAGRNEAMRFGNFAMDRLIDQVLADGGDADDLEIKLFGGYAGVGSQIGEQNSSFVEDYLARRGLGAQFTRLRASHALRVHYFPVTGTVYVKNVRAGQKGTGDTASRCDPATPTPLRAQLHNVLEAPGRAPAKPPCFRAGLPSRSTPCKLRPTTWK